MIVHQKKIDNLKFTITCIFASTIFLLFQDFTRSLDGSVLYGFDDIKTYIEIASCNQLLECIHLGEKYYDHNHHLERWITHFLIGNVSFYTGINLHVMYLLSLFILLIVNALICSKYPGTWLERSTIFIFLLFQPYAFRLYFFSPPMICDALFSLSILLFGLGIVKKNENLLLLSSLIAAISRQTAVAIIPILFFAGYTKLIPFKTSLKSSLLILSVYFFNQKTSIIFYQSDPINTYNLVLTLTGWTKGNEIEFLFYCIFSLLLLSPLLLLNINQKYLLLVVVTVFFISLQPFIAGPGIMGGGGFLRLITQAYPIAVLLLVNSKQDLYSVSLFVLACIAISLHHHYSNSLISRNEFGLIIIVVAMLCLVIKILRYKKSWRSNEY
jgi:hypothetical protein